MKRNLLATLFLGLLIFAANTSAVAQETKKKSSVPTAKELEKIATTTEKGVEALSKLIESIDLSFLQTIDPDMKDEDVPFTKEDKQKVKDELQKGSNAVNNIDFKKVENFLKKIESTVIDFDPDDFLKDTKEKKEKQ